MAVESNGQRPTCWCQSSKCGGAPCPSIAAGGWRLWPFEGGQKPGAELNRRQVKRFLPHTRCRKRGASWQLAAGHRAAGRRAASGNAIKESTSQCALIRGASDCRMPGLLAPAPTAAVPAAALSSLALLMFPLALLTSASASFCVDSATSCVSSRRALYLVAVPSLSLDFLCLPLLSLAFPCFPFPSRPCLSLLLASFLISLAKASC